MDNKFVAEAVTAWLQQIVGPSNDSSFHSQPNGTEKNAQS